MPKLIYNYFWWALVASNFGVYSSCMYFGYISILFGCCSVAKLMFKSLQPHRCRMPGFPVLQFPPEFAQTHVHWVTDAIQHLSHPCRPLRLLPSIFPHIRVFSNEVTLHIWWPKYWSFSVSLSNEYSELISFRIDWFDLLVVHETLKSFSSITFRKNQFFSAQPFLMVQFSHLYMTTGQTSRFDYTDLFQHTFLPGVNYIPGNGNKICSVVVDVTKQFSEVVVPFHACASNVWCCFISSPYSILI